MKRRAAIPIIVDVVAHVLDERWNEMRTDGLMLAAFNSDAAGPIVSGIRAYTREGLALKTED
jgi:hypothetical protein